MKSNEVKEKEMRQTDHGQEAAPGASLKRPWQTPDIIEEDYRETESSFTGPGTADLGIYS
jgi:hypothetical protein